MCGTSEPFPVLCGRKPLDILDHSSGQAFQTSVRNNCDFSTVSSRDGPNSSSRLLDATYDSYSSLPLSEFVNFPPKSPPRSISPEPTRPDPHQAAQSSSPTSFSSASPSPSAEQRLVHCGRCRINFHEVESILKHVAGKYRNKGPSCWPCVDVVAS